MVREASVRIEELASCNISAQRFQYFCGKESTCSISGIYNDLQTFQRFVVISCVDGFTDLHAQICTVQGDQVKFADKFRICNGGTV